MHRKSLFEQLGGKILYIYKSNREIRQELAIQHSFKYALGASPSDIMLASLALSGRLVMALRLL